MKDRVLVTEFLMIRFLMPWIVGLTFDDQVCVNIRTHDLFAK
jgi:hypothetical protein